MMNQVDWLIPAFCGMGLHFRLDGFRLIYAAIAVLMWTVAGIFSLEYMAHYEKKKRYYVFFWATFAATLGVFLSANLYTTYLFFEVMSFTSYVWVAFDEKKESLKAAETYLAVAVIGGLVMLMGLFLLYDLFGTLEMEVLAEGASQVLGSELGSEAYGVHVAGSFPSAKAQLYTAGTLLLFGFGAKAGAVPLHIWLPKAHPVAPAPASALLSGILTKAGVFGIIIVSCTMFGADGGWSFLIAVLGLVTMFVGAFLAIFSVNLKRTLACSSVSQIGFILTGIGMAGLLRCAGEGNLLAVRGAFLHMINHSLIKLVLFLCAGVVYMNLHQLELNEIRGFGRKKPALLFAFLMGALGIGGIPPWNGYVSKTLIHEGIVEYIAVLEEGHMAEAVVPEGMVSVFTSASFWTAAEWVFLFTGGMTVAYMLKLFLCLFIKRHPVRQAEFDAMAGSYMTPLSRLVLCGAAVLLPVLGFFPHQTMEVLADLGQSFFLAEGHPHEVHYLAFVNVKGGLISILIGVCLYLFFVRKALMTPHGYVNAWPQFFDLENLIYRPLLCVVLPGVLGTIFELIDRYLVQTAVRVFLAVSAVACRAMDQAADGVVLLARRTTHRQLTEGKRYVEGNWIAWMLGTLADRGFAILDRLTGRRKRKGKRDSYVIRMRETERNFKHVLQLVEESFSFGLMLFSIGFCATLAYLLFVFFNH